MTACERCWAEYTRRTWGGYNHRLTYADVVREREEEHGPCSPEEQCGEMHLVLDWQDGTRHCRCGKVVQPSPADLVQATQDGPHPAVVAKRHPEFEAVSLSCAYCGKWSSPGKGVCTGLWGDRMYQDRDSCGRRNEP